MATANDTQIKALLKAIETKKAEMGEKPRPRWETNCVVPVNGGVNLNTINSVDRCIELVSQLLMQKGFYDDACKFLNVPNSDSTAINLINSYLADIKVRTVIIKWDAENKKLQAMERRLKDLRSEELKTEDELSELKDLLGTK